MKKSVSAVLQLLAAAAALCTSLSAPAAIIVLSGAMDNLQVVAPVYQIPGDDTSPVIGSTHFRADGVTPVSTSTARGFATVTIDTVALTVTTQASWTGLTGPADRAHLHDAPLGETRLLDPPNNLFFHEVINYNYDTLGNYTGSTVTGTGPVNCIDPNTLWDPAWVLDPCAPATGSLLDVLDLDNSRWDPFGGLQNMLDVFTANGLFLDIHTEEYPGGEIRGQLLLQNAVPEPGPAALLCAALLAAALTRRRR